MLQSSSFLKRLFLIAFILVGAMLLLCGCQTKVQIAPKQVNGLHYKFVDFIGPDSCRLYKCAFQGPEDSEASSVYMTICDGKQSGVQWTVQQDDNTTTYNNETITLSEYNFIDTVIKMVPKMTPDTCFIMRKKK